MITLTLFIRNLSWEVTITSFIRIRATLFSFDTMGVIEVDFSMIDEMSNFTLLKALIHDSLINENKN